MRHEFAAAGPVHLDGQLRSSDLTIEEGEGRVTVDIDHGPEPESVEVTFSGGVLRIEVPQLRRTFFGGGRSYQITVRLPAGSSLNLTTGSGDITSRGEFGHVDVRSGSGCVRATAAQELRIASGSGDVTVTSLGGGSVRTGSGAISIERATGVLQVGSGSGDIEIGRASVVEAKTASGDLSVWDIAGRATLRTASGDLHVRHALNGSVDAVSASGDITVGIAAGTAARLDCSTVSGSTRSTLASATGPGENAETLEVRSRTVSGDILIERAR